MGDRWLDTRTGRTPKPDTKEDKYPSLSPYSYVSNNPIYFFDKDGKEIWITPRNGGDAVRYIPGMSYDGDDYVKHTVDALNYIYNNGADINNAIKTASADDVITKISYSSAHSRKSTYYDYRDKSIGWDDKNGMGGWKKDKGFRRSPALLLFHEFGDRDRHKKANPNKEFDNKEYNKEKYSKPIKKDGDVFPNRGEQIATEEYENEAAEKLNTEKGANEGERKNYTAPPWQEMESPTSTTPITKSINQ